MAARADGPPQPPSPVRAGGAPAGAAAARLAHGRSRSVFRRGRGARGGSGAGDDDEVVAVHASEDHAGPLLEEVAVDLVGAKQRDAPLPLRPLGLHALEFHIDLIGLPLQRALRLEAPVAAV